jgi:Domain of unknown function (DUF4157)
MSSHVFLRRDPVAKTQPTPSRKREHKSDPRIPKTQTGMNSGSKTSGWSFERISIFPPQHDAESAQESVAPPSQKGLPLEVTAANDPSEREAHDVADRVVRTPVLDTATGSTKQASRSMQGAAPEQPAGSIATGRPLDFATRAHMEAAFARDFSRVRVHDGSEAATSARGLNARAYTIGNDIFFAEGQYSQHTSQGARLLAHELTHVVQQSQHGFAVQCDRPPGQSSPAKVATQKVASKTPGLSLLRTQIAAVKAKLEAFARLKQWRADFHTDVEAKYRVVHDLQRQILDVIHQWREMTDHWFYSSTDESDALEKRINDVNMRITQVTNELSSLTSGEEKFETASGAQEAQLWKREKRLEWEIEADADLGRDLGVREFNDISRPLQQLSADIDKFSDDEMKAAVKFTGSYPTSRGPVTK